MKLTKGDHGHDEEDEVQHDHRTSMQERHPRRVQDGSPTRGKVSISPTYYEQHFHMIVFCAAFL